MNKNYIIAGIVVIGIVAGYYLYKHYFNKSS
jgi:hypothetical protein